MMLPEPVDEQRHRYFPAREVLAMYPDLRADRLRCLERWSLVRPAFRASGESFFSFREIHVIRQVNADLGRGTPFRGVLRRLQATRDGQLALDFECDRPAAELIVLPLPAEGEAQPGERMASTDCDVDLSTAAPGPDRKCAVGAAEAFEKAVALDDRDPACQEEAARLYRRALEADPRCVPALVNLANIHHARGNLVEAEALYERALAIDASLAEAHFNLGNLYYDLEHLERACACYERALFLDAAFTDAQFYLAVTLERLCRPDEARPHWRAYQNLAPNGEWAALAREFSD